MRMERRITCSIVEDAAGLAALECEWKGLHAVSCDGYLSQGFDWAKLCWERVAREGRAQLRCIILRVDGGLVALAPLIVMRVGVFRVCKPLASPGYEYCPVLFHPSADAGRACDALKTELARRGDVDAVLLTEVREDSPLAPWLRASPDAAVIRRWPAPFVTVSTFDGWQDYHDRLPHKIQSNLRRNWKRIRQLGHVDFEELTDLAEAQAAWQWTVDCKRAWAARKRLYAPSIRSDDYARFTADTLAVDGHAGRRRIFALKLNGRIIATELVNVDRRRVELSMPAHDERVAECAPGNLLRSEVLRWAFAHGLDYDLRVGREAYKTEWANACCEVVSYALALNRRGHAFAAYLLVRTWMAERTPMRVRNTIRALLGRAR